VSAAPKQDRKTLIVGGIFAVVLLAFGVFAYNAFAPAGPATPPPPPVAATKPAMPVRASSDAGAAQTTGLGVAPGVAAKKMASTSSSLDPTLDEAAMLRTESLVYSGSGRNIFSLTYVAPVVAMPKAVPPARTQAAVPVVQGPVGPPPPPPINLKFFGTETRADGKKEVFLLAGEDVYLAGAGDIVAHRYKIVSIGVNSIAVEDLGNNNTQTLPMQMN